MSEENNSPSKTNGQIAYEAYSQALGGVSGVTGHPLPAWDNENVTAQIKEGWEASAAAVLDAFCELKKAA